MHMADALLSPLVAVAMYAASAAAAGISIAQLRREDRLAPEKAAKKLPTMAVMSALVFAGQMINYTIPGTGSSGHLCGGACDRRRAVAAGKLEPGRTGMVAVRQCGERIFREYGP